MSTDIQNEQHKKNVEAMNAALTASEKEETTESKVSKVSHETLNAVELRPQTLPLTSIFADPARNARTEMGNISDLSQTIKKEGILQPLVVSDAQRPDGKFELIAGYRRYAAAKMAGLKEVPVVGQTADENRRRRMQLIENLQREDMNAIDKANAIKKMMDEEQMESQKEAADALGLSAGAISQYLGLLALPTKAQVALKRGHIDFTQARELGRLKNEEALLTLLPDVPSYTATDLKNKVEFLNQKEKEKTEAKAAREAEKEKTKRAPKKKDGETDDTKSAEETKVDLASSVKEIGFEPLKKTDLLMQIVTYANKFARAETEKSKAENRNILHGLAIAAGIEFKELLRVIG
jgi:ParB family chromosome partitioning protein